MCHDNDYLFRFSRWKDDQGSNKYSVFIPDVDRSVDVDEPNPVPAGVKRKCQAVGPTQKGALFYEYEFTSGLRIFVVCIRRIQKCK